VTEPGNTNAAAEFGTFDPRTHSIDNTHDLMTRYKRKLRIFEVTL
jgi:hypothetical protein